jgi:hypothetical protein
MSNWYTLQELLKFDLIGLPSTVAGLRKKARKEDWKCRAKEGRGGGWEYSVESLPHYTQVALVAKLTPAIEEQPITVGREIDQRKAWANLQILDAYARFEAEYGGNALREELELNFCKLYNQRELSTVSSECVAIIPQISRSTLCKRLREYQLQGLDALGRNSRRIGAIESYPGLQEAIEICLAAGRGRWSPRQVKLALEKSFEDLPFIPSEHQLRRWLNKFEIEQKSKEEVEGHIRTFNAFYRCYWCEVRKPKYLKEFEAEIKIRGMHHYVDSHAFGLDYLIESQAGKHGQIIHFDEIEFDEYNYHTTGYMPKW